MGTVFEFSTAGLCPSERLAIWSERARSIGGMRHDSTDRDSFEGNVRLVALNDLKIGRFQVSANEARWTHELIQQTSDSFLRLIFQCGGEAEIEQGEVRFMLRPGQWALLNASQPHMIRSSHKIEEVVLIVPRGNIPQRLFDATRHNALALPANGGISKLLFEFVNGVLDSVEQPNPIIDDYLGAAGMEMVRALLQERYDERAVSSCRDLRVDKIRSHIHRNLSDPGLSVQSIADTMGFSKRYVHALFAGSESVHSLIWNGRLERSARDLSRKALLTKSITEIALSHGFSCPAHFSRMFKTRFGVPPRAYREPFLNS